MNKNKKSERSGKFPLITTRQLGNVNHTYSSETDSARVKVRYIGKLSSDLVGNVATRFHLRNPTRAQAGSGTYQEVTQLAQLYDEYKVEKLTIQYSPLAPVGVTALGTMYLCTDFDSNDSANLAVTDVIEYNNFSTFDPRYQMDYTVKVPNLVSGQDGNVVGQPAVIHAGGYLDFQTPPLEGNVFLSGENFAANIAIARLVLTMEMKVRRRR